MTRAAWDTSYRRLRRDLAETRAMVRHFVHLVSASSDLPRDAHETPTRSETPLSAKSEPPTYDAAPHEEAATHTPESYTMPRIYVTLRQAQLYEVVMRLRHERGSWPRIPDVAAAAGVTPQSVNASVWHHPALRRGYDCVVAWVNAPLYLRGAA